MNNCLTVEPAPEFKVGDRIQVNFDCPFNKNKRDISTQALLEYLETHPNVLTVVNLRRSRGGGIVELVFVDGIKPHRNGFFPERFTLISESDFNVSDGDLEDLLND